LIPLPKDQRRLLEGVVAQAREIAEECARAVIEQYAVNASNPHDHLSAEDKELRRRLRARARQLGDSRSAKGEHEIKHLVWECAYEHWHRMLFARFLAENDLLIHPTEEVPVSLKECDELAAGEAAADGWELAERYASRMLPQIFRPDAAVLALSLSPECRKELEDLLDSLPQEVFTASDSLGWVYQFWQAKRKDEINASEVKIGADELPAVTQLFTEPYMVHFLLDNSLGAWWAGKTLTEQDLREAKSEEDLRKKASLPGMPLDYIRFVKDEEEDTWKPAAGNFEGWPKTAAELKVLDPCCGSGHFLIEAFRMLVPIRMQEAGLSAEDGCAAVIEDNLHGLEIDERCTQIAAFNLALTAWTYPDGGGYRLLPELNIACSGLAVGAKREEWLAFAGKDERLKQGMGRLYDLFKDAPILGSLIDPAREEGDLFTADFYELQPLLEKALMKETNDFELNELGIAARGVAWGAELLNGKYHLVITNVPYLVKGKQSEKIRNYCQDNYNYSANDIATVFMERCLKWNQNVGTTSIVLPQNFLYLKTYKQLRLHLLTNSCWNIVARLGTKAFQTQMWDFNVQMLIISENEYQNNIFTGLDVSEVRTIKKKIELLKSTILFSSDQKSQLENPDARLILGSLSKGTLLEKYADSYQGIKTGDDARLRRLFWEINIQKRWKYFQGTCKMTALYDGMTNVVDWTNEGRNLARRQGVSAWGKTGASVSQMAHLPSSIYCGQVFDSNVSAIIPKDPRNNLSIWVFCSSELYAVRVREIDQSLAVTNAAMLKVPFDLEYWQKVADEKYPDGLPKPYSDDPTQWLFYGHPLPSEAPLQVAVARLLGYKWPAETDEEMELSQEARRWIKRSAELDELADEDGVVCIPAVRGEQTAAERLKGLLSKAYGSDWKAGTLESLLSDAGCSKDLESWLRDCFFDQHIKLFHRRPFIWHIWDGRRDGFSTLVNYHKLDKKRLETLTYTYLGDWIGTQEQEVKQDFDGAEARLLAARKLQDSLKLILEGEPPYDIFVRWKPIEEQPLGWDPDLNDGVRLNSRPFVEAGVLRRDPKIKWGNDRGKDPESAPWFHEFEGVRVNDYHLTITEKREERERSKRDSLGVKTS